MPGQHLRGTEVTPEATIYVERVGADIAIVRRHGTSARRLAFHGSDGRVRYFLVQTGQQWSSAAGALKMQRSPTHIAAVKSVSYNAYALLHRGETMELNTMSAGNS